MTLFRCCAETPPYCILVHPYCFLFNWFPSEDPKAEILQQKVGNCQTRAKCMEWSTRMRCRVVPLPGDTGVSVRAVSRGALESPLSLVRYFPLCGGLVRTRLRMNNAWFTRLHMRSSPCLRRLSHYISASPRELHAKSQSRDLDPRCLRPPFFFLLRAPKLGLFFHPLPLLSLPPRSAHGRTRRCLY